MAPPTTTSAAGRYRHRVAVQQASYAANAPGESVPTWSTVATLWADVESTGGAEQEIGGRTVALGFYAVRHRYYRPLTEQHRYVWLNADNLVMEIVSIGKDPRKVEHTAACKARAQATAPAPPASPAGYWGSGYWGQ